MGSKIVKLWVEIKFIAEELKYDFEGAKKELLEKFDEWREREKPKIIFGVKWWIEHGPYIKEDNHYYIMEVLFC